MSGDKVVLTLSRARETRRVDGTRVVFNASRCFTFDDGADDIKCMSALGSYLLEQPGLAVYGSHRLLESLLKHTESLRSAILCIVSDDASTVSDWPVVSPQNIPAEVQTVFLCETLAIPRHYMRRRIPKNIKTICPDILKEIAFDILPERAWTPTQKSIYPLDLPEIKFEKGVDMVLMDCPARNLALMPNGIAYVNNALKKTSISFQVFDLDIIAYHYFHIRRLFDEGSTIVLKSGKKLPIDPWQAEHYDLWSDPEVLEYFTPLIDEAVKALLEARPKIVGLSLHACNETFSRKLANAVKAVLPETIILVGGFSCYNGEIGLRAFPECDYMCISEADLTVGPLVEALARGERPRNQPGIVSRYDTPDHHFIPGPVFHDIDKIDFPKYEWLDMSFYRNFNDYQLTPIIASRGCRWSRCTFCAERFYWRIRSPKNFADELEWLVDKGCSLFMFNESDLNGMPEKLLEICDEIIKRDLGVKLTGQLRMHKKSDRAFFQKLRAAGFVALRFGIDAFSENTLRLQKKGYTTAVIEQNLRDCWEAGIYTEVNWVIGVPGETDQDITESIDLILKNQKYIGRLANINPLILTNGSVYWTDPEAHNIHFRAPLAEILEKNPRHVPADLWYSTEPYIDAQVRKERFERIVRTLYERGFPVGAWAARVIDDVETSKDIARTGGTKPSESAWKNSVENSRDKQRETGSLYKVDSALGETTISELPPKIKIVRYAREYYAVEEKTLQDAFNKSASDKIKVQNPQVATDKASIPPRTPLRRIAAILPESVREEVRRVLRIQLYKRRGDTGGRTDGLYASLIVKGLLEEYIVKPVGRLFGLIDDQGAALVKEAVPGTDYSISHVVTKGASPEMVRTIADYNIVSFDGVYYGLQHGLAVDWSLGGISSLPGVITGSSITQVLNEIKLLIGKNGAQIKPSRDTKSKSSGPTDELFTTPQLVGSLEDYNIVSYEGWFYGIPQSIGPVNLDEVDLMETPGVIRDVSRYAVESEIQEQIKLSGTTATK